MVWGSLSRICKSKDIIINVFRFSNFSFTQNCTKLNTWSSRLILACFFFIYFMIILFVEIEKWYNWWFSSSKK
jgi:hypothetical protein